MAEKIILYYKYTDIENPEKVLAWQKQLCVSLKLRGRIIVASEGINGTLGGSSDALEEYKKAMESNALFKDIDFKESEGSAECFPKLMIKIKDEIVNLGLDKKKYRAQNGGVHLKPEDVNKLIESNQDLVLIDTRNDYESRIGTFKNAIKPDTKNFRDFPRYVDDNLNKFKDKKVLMFCTGGVRCERASAYLKSKEVAQEIYQIKGGIHRYVEKYPDGYFRGKNYVFDGRVSVKVTDDILGQCEHCKKSYDDYTNCINAECNIQIIVCSDCIEVYHNTCSQECLDLVKNYKVNIRQKPKKVSLGSN